ncbi:MAG: catalase [Bacillota bacterium]|nr:catalase [Bacillota bacterium]
MTDFLLLEKIHKMIVEMPKPRLMFRKGICMKGYFKPYMSFEEYTTAEVFCNTEASFPVTARFSAMLGDAGSADTVRNIKGFAVKLHCRRQEHDIVSQNIPVYFINDASKFPGLKDALTRRYVFDGVNSTRLWQFAVDNPETINCILRLYSYYGIADSFTDINWFCMNTYLWINSSGGKKLIRYRWKPLIYAEGDSAEISRCKSRVSAEFMAGFDPDKAMEEVEGRISTGGFPAFELQVQILDHKYISHPEYTKKTICWNEAMVRPVTAGVLKLTKLIKEDEEDRGISFAPGNIIDGIELYRDELSGIMDHSHRLSAAERGVRT